jgi:succinoglycan biosynthesis protein ExoO
LYPYYEAAAVVVCPMTVGTGLKIKMVEALRLGKAVVATSAAAEGFPVTENAAWITVPSLPACAEAVVTLLSDRAKRTTLEDLAFAFGQQWLSRDVVLAEVRSILPNRVTSALRRLLCL